jgi:hypothetical protein
MNQKLDYHRKKLLIYFFWGLNMQVAQSQYLRANSLFTFIQNNFDSTIVYFPFSTWNTYPNYYIICKKNEKIFLFTYLNPYKHIGRYPDSLRNNFSSKELKFQFTEADINEYFLPKESNDSVSKIFWSEILKNRIETLISTDDNIACIAKDSSRYVIYDGDEEYFFLITKAANNPVYFYAPEFFENHCPGNKNRIKAIKIIKLFNTLFEIN